MSAWWDGSSSIQSWSPWIFQKPTWERKFQDWSLSAAEDHLYWILLAAVPFSLQRSAVVWEWLSDSQARQSFSITLRLVVDALLRCGGMALMVLHTPGERLQGFANAQISRMVLGARLLGVCALLEATHSERMHHDVQVLELLLRWFIIASLAIPTFEEQTMWVILILGLDMILDLINHETSAKHDEVSSKMPMVLGGLYLLLAGWVISTKREQWFNVLAVSAMHVDDSLQGKESTKHQVTRVGANARKRLSSAAQISAPSAKQGASSGWQDDYFTTEEWEEVKEEAGREQEAMLRRGLVQGGTDSGSYQWIHTNRLLGQGAHGKVRLVKSRKSGKLHAMKTFRLHGEREEKAAVIAEREGTLLRMLDHPNIVSFAEEVRLEGYTLLVMELCTKGSVAWWIDGFGPLDERATPWITAQMLRAVRYMHLNGVSHNDIKLANCLLTVADGRLVVKLADFSISSWKAQSMRIKIEGTISYLPPEIADENASRRRMDIWSLGICVLEMLTGSPSLFEREHFHVGKTIGTLLSMTSDPELPASVPDGVPSDFLRCCLRLDPTERSTAHQLQRHPFVAGASDCPLDSPTVQCILEKDQLHLEDLALKESLLIPRLRRQALFWFSPLAIWRWLADLERPFLNPAVEEEFHDELSNNVIVDQACMVLAPLYFAVNAPWAYVTLAAQPVSTSVRIVLQLLLVWAYTLQSRESRVKNRPKTLILTRVGAFVRIASLYYTDSAAIISWMPLGFAVVILASFLLPSVAEALLWTAAMVAVVTFRVFLDLQRDAAEGGWLVIGDRAMQALMVIATCCAVQIMVVLQARLELRSRFRQTLRKRRNVNRAQWQRQSATWSTALYSEGASRRLDSTEQYLQSQSSRPSRSSIVSQGSLLTDTDADTDHDDDEPRDRRWSQKWHLDPDE